MEQKTTIALPDMIGEINRPELVTDFESHLEEADARHQAGGSLAAPLILRGAKNGEIR
jgi:hypothetical protein